MTQKATTHDFVSAVSTALANGDDIKVSFDFGAIKNWWADLPSDRKNQLMGGLGGLALGSLGGGLLGGGRGAAIGALAGGGLGALGGNYFNPAMGWLKEQMPEEKKAFNNPYAPPQAEEDEEEEEEKRKKSPLLPLVGAGGLGLGLGGLGMLGTAHGMGSDKAWDNALRGMRNMRDSTPQTLPKDTTMLQHYANQMTPASSLAPFGIPVTKVVPFSRYQPWFTGKKPLAPALDPAVAEAQINAPNMQADPTEALLGTNYAGDPLVPGADSGGVGGVDSAFSHLRAGRFSNALAHQLDASGQGGVANFLRKGIGQSHASIDSPAQGRAAAAHYEAFAKGPIPGYDHMLRGYEGHYPIQDTTLTGGREMTNGEYFGPKFTKFIKEKSKKLAEPTGQFLLPHELDQDMMSRDGQSDLLKEWTRSLSPAEQKELHRIESPAISPLGNENYRPIVENFNDIRSKLKKYGLPVAAGGAGLYALYKLVNYIRDRAGDDEEEKQEAAEQSLAKAAEKQATTTEKGLPGVVKNIGSMFQRAAKAPAQGVKNIKSNLASEIGANPNRPMAPQVFEYMGTNHKNPITGKYQLPLVRPTRGTEITNAVRATVLPRIPKSLGGRATGALVTGGLVASQAGPAVMDAADVYRNPEKYITGEGVFDAAQASPGTSIHPAPTGGQPLTWVGDISRDFATNYGTDLTKAKLSGLFGSGDTPYYPYQSRVDAAIGNTMFQYLNTKARNRGAQAAQNAPLITAATPLKGIGPSMLTGSAIRSLGDAVPQEALTLGQAMTKNIPAAYEGVEDPTEILNDLRQSLLLKRMNEARGAVPEGMSLEKDRLLDFLSTRRDALEGPSRDAYQKFINEYTGGVR